MPAVFTLNPKFQRKWSFHRDTCPKVTDRMAYNEDPGSALFAKACLSVVLWLFQ